MTLRSRLRAIALRILDRLENEPVMVTTTVGAVIELLIAFHVPIEDGQKTALMGVVALFIAWFGARQRVTPNSRVPKA